MDATVNDFFKEINKISKKDEIPPQQQEEVWQECLDELTGYSYFWNTQTDQVTWEPPKSYKPAEKTTSKHDKGSKSSKPDTAKKQHELFVPPGAPKFPTTSINSDKVKVYSIQEAINKPQTKITGWSNKKKARFKKSNSSDDEKIELITEYRGESAESEEDNDAGVKMESSQIKDENKLIAGNSISVQSDNEDDDDDIDLLQKIQKRAQELKKLDGDVSSSNIKNIAKEPELLMKPNLTKSKDVSGFSLVAVYNSASDSEEEENPPPSSSNKSLFPLVASPPRNLSESSHSTLFPITKPIDVKDFITEESSSIESTKLNDSKSTPDFDTKAFQRKRRIAVSLVNNVKKPKAEDTISETSCSLFQGLGFKPDSSLEDSKSDNKISTTTQYPGFQKGEVMFVKSSDSLNKPNEEKTATENFEDNVNGKEIEDDYEVLREKLLFLGEGRDPVMPVQVMLIQAETLFTAMTEKGLKLSYLRKWLKETCSELIQLEKDAAPDGWLLQWDRSHKRYFYQNRVTGAGQWDYPSESDDITRCDDAMDISTTPPPTQENIREEISSTSSFGPHLPQNPPLPPSPPQIRSPTPPPPPEISSNIIISNTKSASNCSTDGDTNASLHENLNTVLDSFYSEIAEVTTENSNSKSPIPQQCTASIDSTTGENNSDKTSVQMNNDLVKKKKKKVKLAQGLTMKKKGVSQLVEKWKNVQKSLED